MNDLLNKKCVPCEGGTVPLSKSETEKYLAQASDWVLDEKGKTISKEYKFKDFIGAINFVDKISEIAEAEGHHPDIHIFYSKVLIELSTHAIKGLSENDFILAAKIDASS
ncbi:MAG: putative pterin-4-alpha-carbinolamine dehydratase [Parcubacteria group bacterium GW2011_GWF2_38_8]|nr:MAG: putative pterin-4-alpha-carbinolamine dehydratase [Parcubacteria group bacterium GW2011_GWF2_38_8]